MVIYDGPCFEMGPGHISSNDGTDGYCGWTPLPAGPSRLPTISSIPTPTAAYLCTVNFFFSNFQIQSLTATGCTPQVWGTRMDPTDAGLLTAYSSRNIQSWLDHFCLHTLQHNGGMTLPHTVSVGPSSGGAWCTGDLASSDQSLHIIQPPCHCEGVATASTPPARSKLGPYTPRKWLITSCSPGHLLYPFTVTHSSLVCRILELGPLFLFKHTARPTAQLSPFRWHRSYLPQGQANTVYASIQSVYITLAIPTHKIRMPHH